MGHPVVHFDIGGRDADRSREFYTGLFGWTSEPYGPNSFRLTTNSDRGIDGLTTALGHEPHNYVMVYVEVPSIPRALEKAEELGGSTVVPETDVEDTGSFAWLEDPDGNLVGLWSPAD